VRILIFHGDLTQPTGGEVNARDWALGFKARGHKVAMYATRLGPLAEELQRRGITVVNDPSALSDAPDVMMGTGVHEMATLVARFPGAAGIQVAQQYDNWISAPCPLPQVALHIAVDELNSEMLANEFGVPRDRIRLVYNAVDKSKIAPRMAPLPERPRRMLVFAKHQTGFVAAIEEACAARGMAVECVGNWIARPIADPLQIIRDYDIVFGSARTALEGAACGAAVLVGDGRGFAGMLTTANFEHFRRNNYGREILVRPLSADLIGEEIDKYDAADAGLVADLVLAGAGLDRQLAQIEKIFTEAVDILSGAQPSEDDINRALSRYLSLHLPRVVEGEASPRHRQFNKIAVATPEQQQARLSAVEERFTTLFNEEKVAVSYLEERFLASLKQQQDAMGALEARISGASKEQREALTSLEEQMSVAAAHSADVDRTLIPVTALATAIDRNQAVLKVARPFARFLRFITKAAR
jgi:hypothetical protein